VQVQFTNGITIHGSEQNEGTIRKGTPLFVVLPKHAHTEEKETEEDRSSSHHHLHQQGNRLLKGASHQGVLCRVCKILRDRGPGQKAASTNEDFDVHESEMNVGDLEEGSKDGEDVTERQ